jgi:glycosyl-4,4'-diaponeurosporenoate acyltransferase
MLIELPPVWIILINVAAWPVIHLVVAWCFTQLPALVFDTKHWLCRERSWESDGRFYERALAVRWWKNLLPDAAPWFRAGFAKKRLTDDSADYLAQFARETCRGELAHWTMMLFTPVFFLINPWWADLIIIAYAVLANLPCIVAQRYNRLRLCRVLSLRAPGTNTSIIRHDR